MAAGTEIFLYMYIIMVKLTTAPTGDELLQKDDLLEVAEALLEAKDKAYSLGLALKLSPDEVKSICKTHQDPQERLTAIIPYLLNQIEPRPTWRLIVEGLRSPLVNLPRLAKRIEAAHFPNPTAACDVMPETPNGIDFAFGFFCHSSSAAYIYSSCPSTYT